MPRTAMSDDEEPRPLGPPAQTPEDREQQLIAAAVNLAERQLREGTASAQVITHYLKASSSRDWLEKEKIRKEIVMLDAKVEMMESAQRMEALYSEAITAMRGYAGQDPLSVESEIADDSDDY